jgi:hypothetical protein
MKERPILFSAPMVRAILDGKKTQTRRVIKQQPTNAPGAPNLQAWFEEMDDGFIRCPYGQPGDQLWVRETWNCIDTGRLTQRQDWVRYRATDGDEMYWRPSIFMPRWASRITLKVTAVRVERVQDITNNDARLEGVAVPHPGISHIPNEAGLWEQQYIVCFRALWNEINAKRGYGWDVNPWVWVVEFRKI